MGPFEVAASFETVVGISPLFESILAHLQNLKIIQKKTVNEVITLAKVTLYYQQQRLTVNVPLVC